MFAAAAIWARPWVDLPVPGGRLHVDAGLVTAVEPARPEGDILWVPGLVNAHDHGRGLSPLTYGAPDAPLEPWLWDLRRAPGVDVYLSHLVAFGDMVLSGVTAVVHNHLPQGPDIVAEARAVARAARDVGLRLAMVVPIIDRNLSGYDGGDAALAPLSPAERAAVAAAHTMPPVADQIAAVRAVAAAIDGPDVVTQFGPPGPQWLSRDGWAQVGAAAAADRRRVHTHLLETKPQRLWLDHEEPGGAAAFFSRAGVPGDLLSVAHGVWLTTAEMTDLAGTGVTLALNTSSNLRLASGQANGAALAAAGLALGLGLDGMAIDDDADMWREIRLAINVLGPRGVDGGGLGRAAILAAAFSTGRRCFDGNAGQGLVVGASADMVGLSLTALVADQIDPSPAVTSALVIGRATRRAVRQVIVGGREVVRDGLLTGADLPAARRDLTAQARAAFAAGPPGDWIARARTATLRAYGGRT